MDRGLRERGWGPRRLARGPPKASVAASYINKIFVYFEITDSNFKFVYM